MKKYVMPLGLIFIISCSCFVVPYWHLWHVFLCVIATVGIVGLSLKHAYLFQPQGDWPDREKLLSVVVPNFTRIAALVLIFIISVTDWTINKNGGKVGLIPSELYVAVIALGVLGISISVHRTEGFSFNRFSGFEWAVIGGFSAFLCIKLISTLAYGSFSRQVW